MVLAVPNAAGPRDVRFTPKRGHVRRKPSFLLWPKSGKDMLVIATSPRQRQRNSPADSFNPIGLAALILILT